MQRILGWVSGGGGGDAAYADDASASVGDGDSERSNEECGGADDIIYESDKDSAGQDEAETGDNCNTPSEGADDGSADIDEQQQVGAPTCRADENDDRAEGEGEEYDINSSPDDGGGHNFHRSGEPAMEQAPAPPAIIAEKNAEVQPDENDEVDDSYPRAQDFLAEMEDDGLTLVNEAATIIEGFNDRDGEDPDDAKTVATHRTTGTRVQPVAAAFRAHKDEAEQKRRHVHQSIFDILDRNFEELGEGSNRGGRRMGYRDVKLCFVAFVVVFGLPSAPLESESESNGVDAGEKNRPNANGVITTGDDAPQGKQREPGLQRVPLSVAFALWRKVLGPSNNNRNEDHLSYIRSTLVLLGMLDLASMERDRDDGAPSSGYYGASNKSIECLVVHDSIHRQYGEYLAWGDHEGACGSLINQEGRRWNKAVITEARQMGSNRYTLRMLPLNIMRAGRFQETFDIMGDITFVRRRIRVLEASEAAKAHVGDVDELISMIELQLQHGDATAEAIDQQEGLLGAYRQMRKLCLHQVDEIIKPHKDDEGAIKLGKTAMYQTADIGNALHTLGASLGGYGFFDEEIEYYREALRLKTLAVNGDITKSVSASDTLHSMGFSLDNAGKSEEALECYDEALDIRYMCLGEDDLLVAETLHNKGALLCEEDRADEAMECLEEALRIRELHFGEEHESCADTMQWMGNLLRKHGDPSEALDYFKFALGIKQKRLGSDDIDVANTLFNTAVLLDDLEKFDLSLVAYKEALRIRTLVLGERNPEVADTLFCIGNVATVVENHKEALQCYNESIDIREALIRDGDPDSAEPDVTLLFISNPTSPLTDVLPHYEKLNQCFEESLPLTKLIFGPNHPTVCDLLRRMGDVYMKLHDWDNAVGSFQGALRVKRADVPEGRDDADVVSLLRKKGEAHLYKKEFVRAKATFDTAMQMQKRLSGSDSMPVASATYCLGVAHYYLKDYLHARLLFLDCMRIQRKLAGENDVRVVWTLCWVARQHEKLGEPEKALERYLYALQTYKNEKAAIDYRMVAMLLHAIGMLYETDKIDQEEMSLKCYNEEIVLIHSKLDVRETQISRMLADAHFKPGILCKKRGDAKRAIEHLEKALELTEQCDGEMTERSARIADNLGALYASQNALADARKHYSSAYRVYESCVGRDDLTTSDCAFRLGQVLEAQGSNLALDFYKESLRVHRSNMAEDDERVGEILFCSGRAFLKKKAHQDAVTCFDEALTIRKRLLGDCSDVADTYHNLGKAYEELSQHEKGLIFYGESVRINKILGNREALYEASLDMAQCATSCERFQLAIDSYNDCLQSDQATASDTALVMQRMGEIQMNHLDNFADATKLLLDALEILRGIESRDEDESQRIMDLVSLVAQAYSSSKDHDNAAVYYSEHMKLLKANALEDEDALADDLLALGNIFASMDEPDYEAAIEKLLDCIAIKKRVFGADDERVADVVFALASVYDEAGDAEKATNSYSEALRAYKMQSNRHGTVKVYHALARLKASKAAELDSKTEREAAIECYNEALKLRRQMMSLDDIGLASILFELASLLCIDGEHEAALPLLEEALRIQKAKNGLKDVRVANTLLKMAEVHVQSSKYDSSLVCLEQVLFIQSSLDDGDEIDMSACHFLLGTTFLAREEFQKSIASYLECLDTRQATFGRNSLECADVYNDLGKAFGKIGEDDKAIESLVHALKIRKTELGRDSLGYGHSVLNLADLHLAMTRHDQALNCLSEAERVYKLFPEDGGERLVEVLIMKADTLCEMNDYAEAAAMYQECLSLMEEGKGAEEGSQMATLKHKLGRVSAKLGNYEGAFESYREAINIFSDVSGKNDIRVGDVIYDVAQLMISQGGDGSSAKALECTNEAIRIYRLQGTGKDSKVAEALFQKSTILADNAQYDEASSVLDDAIDLYKRIAGDDAPETVEIGKAMLSYGRLHDAQGDNDEAMSKFDEALRIFQVTLGEDDINVSLALQNIGICRAKRQEYAEAVDSCKLALKIRVKRGDQDQDVAESVFNLANILSDSGEEDEARQYYKQAMKLYTHLLGEDDLTVANCLQKLGSIYWKRNEVERSLQSFLGALRICEQEDEGDISATLAVIYRGIGDCYYDKGDYSLALENFAQCLRMQTLEFGEDCVEMAEPCDMIGQCYQKKGKYEEALNVHSQALRIYEKHHGQGSKTCAPSDFRIAKVLLSLQRYDDCITRLSSHLEIYFDGSDDTEEVAEIFSLLSQAQCNVGKYEESVLVLQKAIDIRTKLLGEATPEVARCMLDLGKVLEESGDSDEAIAAYDQAITVFNKLPDSDYKAIASAYSRLGDLFETKGNCEASLHSWKKALKLYCTNSEGDSIVVGEVLFQIGKVYDQLGNVDKSANCFAEAVKVYRAKGEENAMVGVALTHIGKNYARKKQYTKAVEVITDSLRIQKRYAEAGDIAETLVELGNTLKAWGKADQALKFYEEALKTYEEAAGVDSVEVAGCKHSIGVLKKEMGKPESALRYFGEALRIHRMEDGDQNLNVADALFEIGQIFDSFGQSDKSLQCFEECQQIRQEALGDEHMAVLAAERYINLITKKIDS